MIKAIIFGLMSLFCMTMNDKCSYANYRELNRLTFSGPVDDEFEECTSSMYPNATYIDNMFYFENSIANYHDNQTGICGVVAAQIILNYFDTFYNDNLIEEKYDYTGISLTTNPDFNAWPAPGSGNSIIHNDNSSFIDVLLSMSNQMFPQGMVNGEVVDLLTTYTNSRTGIQFSNTGRLLYSTNYYNHVQDYIDNDTPIICGVPQHFVVVYGYDDDYFYFDTGYRTTARMAKSLFLVEGFGVCIDYKLTGGHVHSDNYYHSTTKTFYCGCGQSHHKMLCMEKDDWGFEQQYFFYNKYKNFTVDGLSFNTKRLRTGYIEETAVNLSPRRSGAGIALFDIVLPYKIKQFTVKMAWWSDHELQNDGAAMIMYEDDGDWLSYSINLLNENLPLSKNTLESCSYIIGFESYGIRFYLVNSSTGDRNLGRLSLGEIRIEYCLD